MTGRSTPSPRAEAPTPADRRRRRLGLAVALRAAFAALLLVTGGAKLLDLRGFAQVVGTYQVLPDALLMPAGTGLALAEVALGLWIASGLRAIAAAWATILLHLGYLAWLLLALVRGLAVPNCGCFGVYWARRLTPWTPLEDVVLLALALLLYRSVKAAPT
jgi:hypothetical protein